VWWSTLVGVEPQVAWQGALFEQEPAGGRLSFDGLRRDPLDARSWIDLVPGWVPDHVVLFDWLLAHAPWQQRTREMWDRRVLEPRLVAVWPAGGQLPPLVTELTDVLSQRYGVDFDSCLVNLYRDGSDAVAWHADTVRQGAHEPAGRHRLAGRVPVVPASTDRRRPGRPALRTRWRRPRRHGRRVPARVGAHRPARAQRLRRPDVGHPAALPAGPDHALAVLDDVLPLLRCPHCSQPLRREGAAVRCPAGHSFDVARQGYLSLLPGGAGTADTAQMVAARDRFLSAGHYDAVGEALAGAVGRGPVVDVGAGTGHHLARVLGAHAGPGLALDLSRHAARRAARAHDRIGAVVADAWRTLPVRDGVAGAVLSVFAPRGPAEALRVLGPGGRLVVVTPTPRHLAELVGPLGLVTVDPDKDERLGRQLAGFRRLSAEPVERTLVLDDPAVRDAVAMGPSARHVDLTALPDLAGEVTLSVRVAAYAPR